MLVRVSSPCTLLALGLAALTASSALAQVENADLRIRAPFRTPNNGQWGARESVGHAEFRIVSRFMQVYYGGVLRADEYKFTVQLDYTGISGFDTNYAASPYNADMDVYINNGFVGRVLANSSTFGIGELTYDSRHAELPDLPLPAAFPDVVNVGDTVRVFFAGALLPSIGDPLPTGTALFTSPLEERDARGDVNQDGHVDEDDFVYLSNNYDPYHRSSNHVGPANGDFTGDNLCDNADFVLFVTNWTESQDAPAEPAAVLPPCPADVDDGTASGIADGGVTIDDLLYYLSIFNLGDVSADVDDGTGTGTPDGGVTIDDLLYFLTRFNLGC